MYVCLFDIDGTLLSSGGAGKAAMEAALLEEFGLPQLRKQVQYSGRTDRSIMRDLLHSHAVEDVPHHLERLIAGYLRRLPDCLHGHEGRVLPGIAELLEILVQREDVAVGLLTGNLRAGARVKLGHYGLFDFFGFGGFGDHHWERDDVAREALAAVRDHHGHDIMPENIWVIGDTPLDISCARAIGARVAAVATGWHSLEELAACKPDLLLADLADPRPLLELLVAQNQK
jgi:phosphoglycolate phosphatase-like HAD superfamily hydrolase